MAKAITREQFVALWESGVRCVSASVHGQGHANSYVDKEEKWYSTKSDFNAVVNNVRESEGWFFAVAVE